MFFSVIVPVYGTEAYLDECLRSILTQSFMDYEIVLVDDGSSDRCAQICDHYAMQYPCVKIVHKNNERLLLTRRRGFAAAEGLFCLCMDSDDFYADKQALQKIYDTIKKTNCDLLLFDYIYGRANKQNDNIVSTIDSEDTLITDKKKLYRLFLTSKNSKALFVKSISRRILDTDADYTEINATLYHSMCEDFVQSLPILTKAHRVSYLMEPLYYYRYNTGSISRKVDVFFYEAYQTAYDLLDQYLSIWQIDDELSSKTKYDWQKVAISHLISSLPEDRAGKKEWMDFVWAINRNTILTDLAQKRVTGKVDRYYRVVAGLIVNDHAGIACVIIRMVNTMHRLLQALRGKKDAV